MTNEQIDALEGEALAQEVLRCVINVRQYLLRPSAVLAIADERAQWWFIAQIEQAMAKRGYWMRLESPWDPARAPSRSWDWICTFRRHGTDYHTSLISDGFFADVAWVAVGRAALVALEMEVVL